MSAPPADVSTHEAHWSGQLFACMQGFAADRTNAVLLTLADVDQFMSERRYPEAGMNFADNRWRAFYHCHKADSEHHDEHGHFHIFTDIGEQAWAHVAGLSIDSSGQPLQWFAVNRWVTDGPWFAREDLLKQLEAATQNDNDAPVGRWLFALLQLYQSSLSDLLALRDEQIQLHTRFQDSAAVLEDPAIYTLATQQIALQSMLENHLLSRADDTHDV